MTKETGAVAAQQRVASPIDPTTTAAVDTAKGGEPKEERLTDEQLAQKLFVTTEQMANRCSVDMVLWNLHSNAVLDAAKRLQSHRAAAGREGVVEECCGRPEAVDLGSGQYGEACCGQFIIRRVGPPTDPVLVQLVEALTAVKQWLFDDDGSPIADEETRGKVNAALALAALKKGQS